MDIIKDYWHQLLALITLLVVAVKLNQEVKELRKDVDDINKRDVFVEVTKLRAASDHHHSQIGALWDFMNKLRDRINGGHKNDKT